MKRKAAISAEALMSENANPGSSNSHSGSGNQSKKRRVRSGFLGDSCIESAASKKKGIKLSSINSKKTVSQEVIDVDKDDQVEQKELLDDMGVNILSDNSNSCDTHQLKNIVKPDVLKVKNTNVIMKTGSPEVAPLKRPDPLPGSRLTNQDIDAGSSSFIQAETSSVIVNNENVDTSNLGYDTSFSDDFFQYTFTFPSGNSKKKLKPVRDMFNRLPAEVALNVFKWLPKCSLAKCARVCKRWNRLTQDESLWRRLDRGLAIVPAGVIGQVLSRGCTVLRLARATVLAPIFESKISGCVTFPMLGGMETTRLQYLDLSNVTIEMSCMETLLSHCSSLRNLSLEMCEVNDIVCSAIAANSNLRILHMGQVQGISQLGISRILSKCHNLMELNLGWTGLSEASLQSICSLLRPQLRRFCLSGNRDTLSDEHMENLLSNCPNLKEIDVSDSYKLTSVSLNLILEHCQSIESISTSRCYSIQPSSYLMLASCPTLLNLNVFGLLRPPAEKELKDRLEGIEINQHRFTGVARPTVGVRRSSIWGLRVRD